MAIYIASDYIDNLNSNTTFTLNVGFQPKAGIFWTTVVNASNYYTSSHPASVGYWRDNNGTSDYACHAMIRTSSSAYAATYTDCVAAAITSTSRSAYITVSNISSTGITLSRSGSSTSDKWRLHWILFGGDVVAKVGIATTPSGATWTPVTVPGAGFDILFSSFNEALSSTIEVSRQVYSLITYHNHLSNLYIYTSNTLSSSYNSKQMMGTDSVALFITHSGSYLGVQNTSNSSNLLIQRMTGEVNFPSYSFAYLSLKSIQAFAGVTLATNTTTSEENKTYTFPWAPRHLLVVSSCWGSTTSYLRDAYSAFAIITVSNGSAKGAYSLQRIGSSLYTYSSLDTVRLSGTSTSTNFANHYIQHVSISGVTWSYKTRTDTANSAVPIFLLGLGGTSSRLTASSNSSKILSRQVLRWRTLFGSSTSDTLILIGSAVEQLLSAVSESLSMLNQGFSRTLSTASGHLSRLLKGFFALLTRSSSSTANLLTLLNKLLRVVSSFSVILHVLRNLSAVLMVVSESLATLVKRLFETLETDSEQTSELEKTILIFLRAFSSWQVWIVLLIEKLLEVVSDTRNDLEREVTYLFRQWEQELHAVSTSLSEIFRTFFRELLAETYQWVRMERIRGPVFALRSWLWRVRRRKHGCS